jgi:hypothetical protein
VIQFVEPLHIARALCPAITGHFAVSKTEQPLLLGASILSLDALTMFSTVVLAGMSLAFELEMSAAINLPWLKAVENEMAHGTRVQRTFPTTQLASLRPQN